jgi:hypothetical protein
MNRADKAGGGEVDGEVEERLKFPANPIRKETISLG